MTLSEIARLRLIHQRVKEPIGDPARLVSWMGAMQAQDFPMAKWAIGVRTKATNQRAILNSLDNGTIIRTHVLRPTWHFVSAADASWMLDLTGPRIKRSMSFRHRQLELTPAILKKSYRLMEKALTGGRHLTREALVGKLNAGKIATHDQRAAHILVCAELDKLICSGAMQSHRTTYALFAERIPNPVTLRRDEALSTLTRNYFTSHGPATLQDFSWWSGLPLTEARGGLESIKKEFESVRIETLTYWFKESSITANDEDDSVHLLPAFDEFIISYKDRTACLPRTNHKTTISMNGFFKPVIVINGQVTGTWKKSIAKKKIIVETAFFPKEKIQRKKEVKRLIALAEEKVREFYRNEDNSTGPAAANSQG